MVSLATKVRAVEKLFGRKLNNVFQCPCGDTGYRMKVSLRVCELDSSIKFAFTDPNTKAPSIVQDDHVSIVNDLVNSALPVVRAAAMEKSILGQGPKLFEAKFQSTLTRELAVTLMYRYHFHDNDAWLKEATSLQERLLKETDAEYVTILGRSKGRIVKTGREFLYESFEVDYLNEKTGLPTKKAFHYKQNTESFSQPNAYVNKLMLDWAVAACQRKNFVENDLLELYCGNGNFTVPLAGIVFNRVLATEVGRESVRDALWALEKNRVRNTQVVRLSAAEVQQAMHGERQFQRMRNVDLDSYSFRTILVDPPRVGLDAHSVRLLSSHTGQIIYISCNPVTLKRDLDRIEQTSGKKVDIHELVCFDQFPGTDHIECGVEFELV